MLRIAPGPPWLHAIVTGRDDEPGLAVAVVRGGEVVERCVGLASLRPRRPIESTTRFHVVSVSKTFLAATILDLAARGALRLDDDVRRHLPELPSGLSRDPVTIRHLLSMTSGLRDVLEVERLRGVWTPSASRRAELLELAFAQTSVSAPPGAQYMYANVNALLLEELAGRVGGAAAERIRAERLYGPLGLTHTGARDHDGPPEPDLAEPYVADGAGHWTRAVDLLGISADPLTTSLGDLTRWVLALGAGSVGGVDVRAMAEPTRLSDGTAIYYGLGLAVRRYRGLTVLCHTGSQPGYKCHVAFVPARDVAVVVLSNREDTRPTALAAAVIESVVGGDLPASVDARQRLASCGLTDGQLASIPGTYVDEESGEWLALAFEDGVLRGEALGDPLCLYAERDGTFRDGDDYRATAPAELRFQFGNREDDVTARLTLGGLRAQLRKQWRPPPSTDALREFAGRYESGEMGSRHTVEVRDGALAITYGDRGGGRRGPFPLAPVAPDVFLAEPAAPGIAYRHVFRFERDRTGVVSCARVTMERLKGVPLHRVD